MKAIVNGSVRTVTKSSGRFIWKAKNGRVKDSARQIMFTDSPDGLEYFHNTIIWDDNGKTLARYTVLIEYSVWRISRNPALTIGVKRYLKSVTGHKESFIKLQDQNPRKKRIAYSQLPADVRMWINRKAIW